MRATGKECPFQQKYHGVKGQRRYPGSVWANRVAALGATRHKNAESNQLFQLSPIRLQVLTRFRLSAVSCLNYLVSASSLSRASLNTDVRWTSIIRADGPEDTVGIFCPLGKISGSQSLLFFVLSLYVHTVISFVFLSDYNCGERGPSKDISGFPEHPPFSFGAKNRELRVSWGCTFPMKLNSTSFLKWFLRRTVWLNSRFSLRSFDTESEGSRWVPPKTRTPYLDVYLTVCPEYQTMTLNQLVRDLPFISVCFKCCTYHLTSPLWTPFSKLSHQPALLFQRDPYLLPSARGEFRPLIFSNITSPCCFSSKHLLLLADMFSNVVIEGVVHGVFYPDLHPR